MNDEIATRNDADMGAFDPNDEQILNYLQLNPRDPKSRAVVAVCQRYGLDPVLKHVIVIPKGGAYITRDGYLHIAHRSGQLDGIVVEEEPHLVDGEWRCKVSVYRKDMRFPFTFPGRYPVNGGNKQYAQEMALKVAESHAYRRAFDVAGLPSFDEHEASPQQEPTAAPVQTFTAAPVDTITDEQVADLEALMDRKGIPAEQRVRGVAHIVKRAVESLGELTEDELQTVADHLAQREDAQAEEQA